jgi:transposase
VVIVSQASKIRSSLKGIRDPIIRERLMMIQAAYEGPLRDAGRKFGCAHGKVDFWKKRYEAYGIHGLHTKPRSGRPPKITQEQSVKLRRIVRKHDAKKGWRTQGIKELIYEETGVNYSFRHTIRIAQSWGVAKIKPRPRYAFSRQEDRDVFLKKRESTWHASTKAGRSWSRTKASSSST